jgi:hypothetical protein
MEIDKSIMHDVKDIEPITMIVANKQKLVLKEKGKIKLENNIGGTLVIDNVTYAPDILTNLLSVAVLCRKYRNYI